MEVHFYPSNNRESKIQAFADVAVTDGILVKGFRIVDGVHGLFAAVPSKSIYVEGKQRFVPQVVFRSPDHRERFLSEVLESFRRWQEESSTGEDAPGGEPAEVPF